MPGVAEAGQTQSPHQKPTRVAETEAGTAGTGVRVGVREEVRGVRAVRERVGVVRVKEAVTRVQEVSRAVAGEMVVRVAA